MSQFEHVRNVSKSVSKMCDVKCAQIVWKVWNLTNLIKSFEMSEKCPKMYQILQTRVTYVKSAHVTNLPRRLHTSTWFIYFVKYVQICRIYAICTKVCDSKSDLNSARAICVQMGPNLKWFRRDLHTKYEMRHDWNVNIWTPIVYAKCRNVVHRIAELICKMACIS